MLMLKHLLGRLGTYTGTTLLLELVWIELAKVACSFGNTRLLLGGLNTLDITRPRQIAYIPVFYHLLAANKRQAKIVAPGYP
ncbi:hypothetical protein F5Y10DRAFT_238936 [Nemania abortiva]|nr:hypothetical protein F5Y10DRAFT_238936 [Nemania abortiva]